MDRVCHFYLTGSFKYLFLQVFSPKNKKKLLKQPIPIFSDMLLIHRHLLENHITFNLKLLEYALNFNESNKNKKGNSVKAGVCFSIVVVNEKKNSKLNEIVCRQISVPFTSVRVGSAVLILDRWIFCYSIMRIRIGSVHHVE